MRRRGVHGQAHRVTVEHDHDVVEPALEPARNNERVAAIVSRSGEDEHARRTLGEQIAGDARRRVTGTLHQRLAGGSTLDRAEIRDAPDRLESHAAIIGPRAVPHTLPSMGPSWTFRGAVVTLT